MAGRRRQGAFAGTVSQLVLQDRERRFKREDLDALYQPGDE